MPQNINLIDSALLPARRRLSPPLLLGLLGLAAALVLGHWSFEQMRLARALAQASDGAPTEAAAPESPPTDGAAQERLAQREALRNLLRGQVAATDGNAPLIAAVLGALPASVWLTELELELGSQRKLRISGGTLDSAGFGQLSAALNNTAALRGLPLNVVRLEPQPAAPAAPANGDGTAGTPPAAHLFVLEGATAAPTPAGEVRP